MCVCLCVLSHAAWQHANPYPILFLRLRHLVHFDQPCALFPDMLIKKVHNGACEHVSVCEHVRITYILLFVFAAILYYTETRIVLLHLLKIRLAKLSLSLF